MTRTDSRMIPRILRIPVELDRMIQAFVPPGQSRSEWIREAIRQRIRRERPSRPADRGE